MIERIEIRNFQSLRSIDLELGRYTVIVGPSSSGKSALLRAIRAVASNVSGDSVITRGATACAVTVRTADAAVTLEHSRGAWRYRLVDGQGEREYSKLNRSVPEDVTRALGIDPVPANGFSRNVAGQFDRPYLLTESGAVVARELGALTNVDTIYAAVREANRRLRTDAATLKTRKADLEQARADAARFAGLKNQLDDCDRAERTLSVVTNLQRRVERLRAAVAALDVAETIVARTTVPPAPDTGALDEAQNRLHRLRDYLGTIQRHQIAYRAAHTAVEAAERAEADDTAAVRRLLVEHGTCPTCEQPVA